MVEGFPSFLEYDPTQFTLPGSMRQIIPGKVGGKARGLLFASHVLESQTGSLADDYTNLLEIPPGFLIGTDLFQSLIESNTISHEIRKSDYARIREAFVNAQIPEKYRSPLLTLLQEITCPLAVRSSSLLEDSLAHSFAGFYLTLFLANGGAIETRLVQLETAIKLVLASTYNPNAAVYRHKHGLLAEDEKMGVLIQPMVGRRRENLFYPLLGGVAFSKNYYPWSERVRRDDGMVRLVYGLGTRAVGRNYARTFSLSDPRLRPEGTSLREILKYSQEFFDALDLESGGLVSVPTSFALPLPDNGLGAVSSVLKDGDYLIETTLAFAPGDRFVLTFDPIVTSNRYLPFVPMMRSMLRNLERECALPVDIEFAADFKPERKSGEWGKLYLLQVRPMSVRKEHRKVTMEPVQENRILIDSSGAMGNGLLEGVRDIVFVSPERYHQECPGEVAREIGRLNSVLGGQKYILIGPGRWGSTNPQLGVPVSYADISNAAVIIEIAGGKFAPELSYGTHFFADLLADTTLFLSVRPERGDSFRRNLLPELRHSFHTGDRHIHVPKGLTVRVDGASHRGQVILSDS